MSECACVCERSYSDCLRLVLHWLVQCLESEELSYESQTPTDIQDIQHTLCNKTYTNVIVLLLL